MTTLQYTNRLQITITGEERLVTYGIWILELGKFNFKAVWLEL